MEGIKEEMLGRKGSWKGVRKRCWEGREAGRYCSKEEMLGRKGRKGSWKGVRRRCWEGREAGR
jgi:hypothetical protein